MPTYSFVLPKQVPVNFSAESKIRLLFSRELSNTDEQRVGVREYTHSRLAFESRFESGNLRKAIQVGNLALMFVVFLKNNNL